MRWFWSSRNTRALHVFSTSIIPVAVSMHEMILNIPEHLCPPCVQHVYYTRSCVDVWDCFEHPRTPVPSMCAATGTSEVSTEWGHEICQDQLGHQPSSFRLWIPWHRAKGVCTFLFDMTCNVLLQLRSPFSLSFRFESVLAWVSMLKGKLHIHLYKQTNVCRLGEIFQLLLSPAWAAHIHTYKCANMCRFGWIK